jgi:hypothetical protein
MVDLETGEYQTCGCRIATLPVTPGVDVSAAFSAAVEQVS